MGLLSRSSALAGLLGLMVVACMCALSAQAESPKSIAATRVPVTNLFFWPASLKSPILHFFPGYVFRFPQCGPRDDAFLFTFDYSMSARGYIVTYSWQPNDYSSETAKSMLNGITDIIFDIRKGILTMVSMGIKMEINMHVFKPTATYQQKYEGSVQPTGPFFWNVVDRTKSETTVLTRKLANAALHILGRAAAKFGEGDAVKYPCRENKTIPGSPKMKELSQYLHAVKEALVK